MLALPVELFPSTILHKGSHCFTHPFEADSWTVIQVTSQKLTPPNTLFTSFFKIDLFLDTT